MASKPGDYITAKCGRCNDITGHVVMLVLGGEITKVECKACGSVHKYRDAAQKRAAVKKGDSSVLRVRAGQARETAAEVRPARAPAAGMYNEGVASTRPMRQQAVSARKQRGTAAKTELAWQEAMMRHSGENPVEYSMRASYTPGDFVEHPVFGKGEVYNVIRPDKAEIIFQEGVKTLRCML